MLNDLSNLSKPTVFNQFVAPKPAYLNNDASNTVRVEQKPDEFSTSKKKKIIIAVSVVGIIAAIGGFFALAKSGKLGENLKNFADNLFKKSKPDEFNTKPHKIQENDDIPPHKPGSNKPEKNLENNIEQNHTKNQNVLNDDNVLNDKEIKKPNKGQPVIERIEQNEPSIKIYTNEKTASICHIDTKTNKLVFAQAGNKTIRPCGDGEYYEIITTNGKFVTITKDSIVMPQDKDYFIKTPVEDYKFKSEPEVVQQIMKDGDRDIITTMHFFNSPAQIEQNKGIKFRYEYENPARKTIGIILQDDGKVQYLAGEFDAKGNVDENIIDVSDITKQQIEDLLYGFEKYQKYSAPSKKIEEVRNKLEQAKFWIVDIVDIIDECY